ARAERVHVGGVEEVDPELQSADVERPAGVLVEGPGGGAPGGVAVAHAAEADLRDGQARPAELHVLHEQDLPVIVGRSPCSRRDRAAAQTDLPGPIWPDQSARPPVSKDYGALLLPARNKPGTWTGKERVP